MNKNNLLGACALVFDRNLNSSVLAKERKTLPTCLLHGVYGMVEVPGSESGSYLNPIELK